LLDCVERKRSHVIKNVGQESVPIEPAFVIMRGPLVRCLIPHPPADLLRIELAGRI
jgi:hypothetical protein